MQYFLRQIYQLALCSALLFYGTQGFAVNGPPGGPLIESRDKQSQEDSISISISASPSHSILSASGAPTTDSEPDSENSDRYQPLRSVSFDKEASSDVEEEIELVLLKKEEGDATPFMAEKAF